MKSLVFTPRPFKYLAGEDCFPDVKRLYEPYIVFGLDTLVTIQRGPRVWPKRMMTILYRVADYRNRKGTYSPSYAEMAIDPAMPLLATVLGAHLFTVYEFLKRDAEFRTAYRQIDKTTRLAGLNHIFGLDVVLASELKDGRIDLVLRIPVNFGEKREGDSGWLDLYVESVSVEDTSFESLLVRVKEAFPTLKKTR